jgi:hypothetical protein
MAPVTCVPLVARVPDQPLDAVQDATSLDDQVSVAVSPLATLVGLALSDTPGVPIDEVVLVELPDDVPEPMELPQAVNAAITVAASALRATATAVNEFIANLRSIRPRLAPHDAIIVQIHVHANVSPMTYAELDLTINA